MWTANITGQNLNKGILQVTVEFTNGTDVFPIIYDMSGGTIENLNIKIISQINTLNNNDLLLSKLVIGPFTGTVPQPTEEDLLSQKRTQLILAKQDVDLGIISATDPVYTSALQDAQSVFAQVSPVEVAKI